MTTINVPTRDQVSMSSSSSATMTVTNYLHGTTLVPVDFPAAPALTN